MEKKDYVKNYLSAYNKMKDAAIRKMKEYGNTLEVIDVCRRRLMKRLGYGDPSDVSDEDLEDYKYSNTYSCVFEGKHGILYCCRVMKVRYNIYTNDVDVFLESDEGDVSEWFDASYIGFDSDAIYMTIHDFVD